MRRAVGAELPWGIGVCAFTLAPDHPEVLLVPDMKADARFNSMCAALRCSVRSADGVGHWRIGGSEGHTRIGDLMGSVEPCLTQCKCAGTRGVVVERCSI